MDGKVTQVAGSKHALGFAGPGGIEILIHAGDEVEAGTELLKISK